MYKNSVETKIFNDFNLSFFLNSFAGLLSWNASNCHVNLEEELNTITIQALDGEEGKNGKWKSCGTQQISHWLVYKAH